MIRILVLTLVLLTFLYFLFKKESFQTNIISLNNEIVQEEEEEQEEEQYEDEITIAIKSELDAINDNIQPVLNFKKPYNNYNPEFESYGAVEFNESEKTMFNKNEDIPIEPPMKFKPFPSRKNEHTWDYTGVHKIEKRGDCYKGVDSSLNVRNPHLFNHPVNFEL